MGVRGMHTFLERENQTFSVNFSEEVKKWKREHPDQTPTIVIDFLSLKYCVSKMEPKDTICGGRHNIILDAWRKLLDALKASGCSLVFFADLYLQEDQKETRIIGCNEKYNSYQTIYQLIDDGASIDSIVAANEQGLNTTFSGMDSIARGYGDFHYTVKHKCDLEIAQYATKNNAIAVISSDTDFLIFMGPWRLWSSSHLRITPSNEVESIEYDRNGIANVCSLSQQQIPLFATLVGNDFTTFEKMRSFRQSMGPKERQIHNIAKYVREFGSGHPSDSSIKKISRRVFGCDNDENQKLIRQSIESYNTDVPTPKIDDPLEKDVSNTSTYQPYRKIMGSIHSITMSFYDMESYDSPTSFPQLMTEWLKREIGVCRSEGRDDSFTFVLLTKKYVDQPYQEYEESPIYPNFPIPSLDDLYMDNDDTTIVEKKWEILKWIMSLDDKTISKMKKLPKHVLLVSTLLYALVKNKLIVIDEADGILYTQEKVRNNEIMTVEYPTALVAKYFRAAHLYNITFAHVRRCFTIAGLRSNVEGWLQFDGVFYQKLMEKVGQMSSCERDELFAPIKAYRIYASD